jgi:integrase
VRNDGTTRQRLVAYGTTKTQAETKLLELRRRAKKGETPTGSQTVSTWFDYWLEKVAVNEVRPKTLANYRSQVKTHILPVIGSVRLSKLTPAHIRKVTDKVKSTRASSTALTVHRILSSSLAQAESDGKLDRNPAKLAKAPRRKPPELETLTTTEAKAIVRRARENSPGLEAYLWATFLLTGARRGEIIGLEWDRVSDVLDLSWQLQRHTVGKLVAPEDYESRHLVGGLYMTRPKSAAGWRVVPLVHPLSDILADWRAKADPNPYGLVFTRNGEPLDPDWVSKEWPRVLKTTGIAKHVRLHDLRHTAVDLMYEAGVPETVIQEIVGHSSRAMTRAYKSRSSRPQLVDGMNQWAELLA